MSLESTKALLERMKNDQEFAKKIMAETSIESRIALAHAEGFHCTMQELEQVTSELTDDDLEQVVGGFQSLLPKNSGFT